MSLRPKYSPQHPILKHPQPTFLPQCQRPSFTPIQDNGQNYSSIYLGKVFKLLLLYSGEASRTTAAEQDRQCTWQVTLRHVRTQLLLQWKNNKYYVLWACVCSLSYTACNARVSYCRLWPARLYNIFPHYFIKGMILEKKKLLNIKCVFWFSIQFLLETFLILRRNERSVIINVHRSLCKAPVIPVRFSSNLNFLDRFSKNTQVLNFTKIRQL